MSIKATAAVRHVDMLDPSAALSFTAEHVPETGSTFVKLDVRQGMDVIVFTVRAEAIETALANALALVRGERT